MNAPYLEPDSGWHGDRSRGAGMGRPTHAITGSTRVHLRRVPAVDGDYDPGGAYWGSVGGTRPGWHGPEPLYCAWDDSGGVQWIRAASREAAKAKLPTGLKFYR